jgi:hypothetical protein
MQRCPKWDEDSTLLSRWVSSSIHVMWLCLTQSVANRQSISVPCATSYLILICRLSSELLSSSFMAGITTCDILRIFTATTTCDLSLHPAKCISGTRESLKHVQLGRHIQASGYSSCPIKYPYSRFTKLCYACIGLLSL